MENFTMVTGLYLGICFLILGILIFQSNKFKKKEEKLVENINKTENKLILEKQKTNVLSKKNDMFRAEIEALIKSNAFLNVSKKDYVLARNELKSVVSEKVEEIKELKETLHKTVKEFKKDKKKKGKTIYIDNNSKDLALKINTILSDKKIRGKSTPITNIIADILKGKK